MDCLFLEAVNAHGIHWVGKHQKDYSSFIANNCKTFVRSESKRYFVLFPFLLFVTFLYIFFNFKFLYFIICFIFVFFYLFIFLFLYLICFTFYFKLYSFVNPEE